MRYGYARVADPERADYCSLSNQEKRLFARGCDEVICEVCGGRDYERPLLSELVEEAEQGDEIVLFKLDRLTTSIEFLTKTDIIDRIDKKGIVLRSLDFGELSGTPVARLVRNMMIGFVEYDYDARREGWNVDTLQFSSPDEAPSAILRLLDAGPGSTLTVSVNSDGQTLRYDLGSSKNA